MRILTIIILFLLSTTVFGFGTNSGISFINATRTDNLIVLARIISFPNYDSTKNFCPGTMVVEIIEVLKGKDSSKLLTVKGRSQSDDNDLACLYFYSPGEEYILGLDDLTLLAPGNHSLDFKSDTVRGNITNEPTKEYLKQFKKIIDKLQKEESKKNKNIEQLKLLRKELSAQRELLNQTMDYKTFKQALVANLDN